jgi:hypothetical protein
MINKCYVENLRHFLAQKIPHYGLRYLGLEGVYRYGDQLETRMNADLHVRARSTCLGTGAYYDGSDRGAIVMS